MATGALAAPAVYQLHVDGLACPFCAYGIEKKLGEVKGVRAVQRPYRDRYREVAADKALTMELTPRFIIHDNHLESLCIPSAK